MRPFKERDRTYLSGERRNGSSLSSSCCLRVEFASVTEFASVDASASNCADRFEPTD